MKRVLQSISAMLIPLMTFAWAIPDETLHYSVRFKWGLIDANVGIAKITTCNDIAAGRFTATLSGKSVDLLGHYYEASDTISGSIMANGIAGRADETIYDEAGQFAIETITYNAEGPSKEGPVVQHLPNGKVIRSRVSNYGSGLTIDLLAVFYYMRQIDYGQHNPGQAFRINLSNGSQIESLAISYLGTDNIQINGESHETYHIALTFSSEGSSKCDNMNVWISTDDSRIPMLVNGSLSVGHMECRYVNSDTVGQLNGF